MDLPEHLWRFPTRKAIDKLAKRFNLPNNPRMQDWEYEVADSNRIKEFVQTYKSGELDDDERFTLMETIIQSFEDTEKSLEGNKDWYEVLALIKSNLSLHIYTVCYWAVEDSDNEDEQFRVTPYMREILMEKKIEYSSGGVIYQKNDRNESLILLIRIRKQGWELPKGHIEIGEKPEATAIRECKEEVGINCDIKAEEKIGEIVYQFFNKNRYIEKVVEYYMISFTGEFKFTKPKQTREIRWIKENELESIPLVNEDLSYIIKKTFKKIRTYSYLK